MSKNILKYLAIILTLITIAACGGGGGGGGAPAPSPTTATLKISLTGILPSEKAISGAEFVLTLPAGVTPAMANDIVTSSVVIPSGTFDGGVIAPPVYTPATINTAGTVRIPLATANEFGVTMVGEVATITLQLSNGAQPTVDGFTFGSTGVNVTDLNYIPITGFKAIVSDLQLH